MKLLLLLLLCLCSACSTVEGPVRRASTSRTTTTRRTRIEWVDDPHQACEQADGQRTVIGIIRGCAKIRGDECTIYAKRPTSEKDYQRFVTLGHELMHCAEGNWHNQWGEMLR